MTAPSPAPVYEAAWAPAGRKISPRWTTIVIHHSATATGGAAEFDRYHRDANGWDELGYHFVIGNGTHTPDGYIEVGSRWHKQKHGAHCKTTGNYYNEHGIGICLVGDFTKSEPTERQLASLQRLTGFLMHRCGIPPSRLTTHAAVTGKTRCPGGNFKLADLKRSLAPAALASSLR
ncbi:MAG: N-acetylmuramoyl-L-alanine amidase [Phycisphaerales bacterium]|nr:MAG: N-acetylmuramoyl-L-alanine amidase [Phycisphaerales bacterium]